VVLATGARYRRLNVENLDAFEASSVHYWASPLEARLCANQEVALVGAGNSAGQAAVYLASHDAKFYMLVRRSDLAETMSRYLVDRIKSLANIEIVTGATISSLEGRDGVQDAVWWRQRGTGQEVRRAINHLFLFIGADPNTDWLKGSDIALEGKGFILSGAEAGADATCSKRRAAAYLPSATCVLNQ
jgi:thioredoxin reductase (NADPH)